MEDEKRSLPENLSSLVVDYIKNKIFKGQFKEETMSRRLR